MPSFRPASWFEPETFVADPVPATPGSFRPLAHPTGAASADADPARASQDDPTGDVRTSEAAASAADPGSSGDAGVETPQALLAELDAWADARARERFEAGRRLGRDEGLAEGRESGMNEGREQGRAEGLEAGAAAARQELPIDDAEALGSATQALENVARGLQSFRRRYLEANRRNLVELAAAIAERILAREVERDPEALVDVVARAVPLLGDDASVRVRLSARDHATLERSAPARLEALREEHGLSIEIDPRLTPGDVRVLSDQSEVDARLGTVVQRIQEELAGEVDVGEEAGP